MVVVTIVVVGLVADVVVEITKEDEMKPRMRLISVLKTLKILHAILVNSGVQIR